MKGLSCLLPRKSKEGKLYLGENLLAVKAFLLVTGFRIGPKPITRRLILAASPPVPDAQNPAVLNQNPPRHSYPTERFKHRWTPYGSSTLASAPPIATDSASAMDVDHEGGTSPTTQKPKKRSKITDGSKKSSKKPRSGKP